MQRLTKKLIDREMVTLSETGRTPAALEFETLRSNPVLLKRPLGIMATVESNAPKDDGLTLEKLVELASKLTAIGPVPFLASDSMLRADRAIRFEFRGRSYVGAHPTFWAKVRRETNPYLSASDLLAVKTAPDTFTGVTIWDLDGEQGRFKRIEFYQAMSEALGQILVGG